MRRVHTHTYTDIHRIHTSPEIKTTRPQTKLLLFHNFLEFDYSLLARRQNWYLLSIPRNRNKKSQILQLTFILESILSIYVSLFSIIIKPRLTSHITIFLDWMSKLI